MENTIDLKNGDKMTLVSEMPVQVYRQMRADLRKMQMSVKKDPRNQGEQSMVVDLGDVMKHFDALCIRWLDSKGVEKPKTINELEKLGISDYIKVEQAIENLTTISEETETGKK